MVCSVAPYLGIATLHLSILVQWLVVDSTQFLYGRVVISPVG